MKTTLASFNLTMTPNLSLIVFKDLLCLNKRGYWPSAHSCPLVTNWLDLTKLKQDLSPHMSLNLAHPQAYPSKHLPIMPHSDFGNTYILANHLDHLLMILLSSLAMILWEVCAHLAYPFYHKAFFFCLIFDLLVDSEVEGLFILQ